MPEKFGESMVLLIHNPPCFCEYADGSCDQDFAKVTVADGLFLYPSQPLVIARTIEEGAQKVSRMAPDKRWRSWKDLDVGGKIIFCEICKAMRFSKLIIADVSTLNFNLLFEIGYAFGLGVAVLPIRDVSYSRDQRIFDELGLLDSFGYLDFENSTDLADGILKSKSSNPLTAQNPELNKEQPLYLMRSKVQNEGMVKLMSALKKTGLRFRTFDPRETPRISLHEVFKQVLASLAVIVHLVAPDRLGAAAHNGRCAFAAGMAMAAGKKVLMLQETEVSQPIDYRDVVKSYQDPSLVPDLIRPLIREVVETLQESRFVPITLPLKPLEKIDFGDLAAENEIRALRSYFVPTAQYNETKRGHARLVVGRKGAGKTAIFYGVRSAFWPSNSHVVLDLKPEGHQFVKLREAVLRELSPGLQQHVLTAFWNYLLLMEIAYRIVRDDSSYAYRHPRTAEPYQRIVDASGTDKNVEQGDFSERLLTLVDEIVHRKKTGAQDCRDIGGNGAGL